MSFSPFVKHPVTFQLTSVGNINSQFVTVYTGTITGGGSNAYGGYTFTIAGFTNSQNNGSWLCVQSTTTTLTLFNAFGGTAETHAATATSVAMLAVGGQEATLGTFLPAGTSPTTIISNDPAGAPVYFGVNGITERVNIGSFNTWRQVLDISAPIQSAVNISPNSSPTFPFSEAIELNFVTDPAFTGDATGCFVDAVDVNNSIVSPAYWGQLYGILVEHGMSVANGKMCYVDDFRRIYAETLNGNGAGTNAAYHSGQQIGFNCATGGFLGPQHGIVGTSWGMNFEGPRQGGGLGIWNSHSGIRMASQKQGSVLGTFTLSAASASSTSNTFSVTSVATSVNGTAVYTGTGFTVGASYFVTFSGFSNAGNNGTYYCLSNTGTTMTVTNSAAIAESASASAITTVSTYTGTFANGASNALAGQLWVIKGFAQVGSTLALTSVATTVANNGSFMANVAGQNGVAVYTGTIGAGGDSNGFMGRFFTIAGFSTGANNGTFFCIASTRTTLTLGNAHAVTETTAATAAPQVNNGIFLCTASSTTTITVNNYLGASETHAGTAVARNGSAWAIHQDDGGDRNAMGIIYLGGESGPVMQSGAVNPNSLITSSIGGMYLFTGGSTGSSMFVKESGSGNTGWVPLRNAALNAQTGTSYSIQDSDRSSRITFSNTAAVAVTLPQANGTTFVSGWYTYVENINTGIVTITPTTSTINGWPAITLFSNQWAIIFSDGTNYQVLQQPLASTDPASAVSGYLTNDAGLAAARNQIIVRNINTGVNSSRKGMNVYLEHDGAVSNANYDGFHVNLGFTVDGFTNKTQGQTDGAEIVAYGAFMNATFTSVANASAGSTVYTGTIENGASNGGAGLSFIVTGFTNGANNGTFTCTASTATTITLSNASGVAETHAGAAVVAANFALTSVGNHSGTATIYTGTIPGGASNFYAGWQFRILGFTNAVNNGLFPCTASSATTLTLTNANGTSETTAATAAWMTITEINILKLRWGASQSGNILNNTGILQYLPVVGTTSTIENFTGFAIDAPGVGGFLTNYTGVYGGNNLNGLTVQTAVGFNGVFIDTTVGSAYGGIFGAKSGSVLADDAGGVARSFIGHANCQLGPPFTLHDGWYGSTGTPEGVVTAAVGSMFSRQDSTIGDAQYLKASGSGNTGWAPSSTIGPIKTVSTTYSATNSDGTINGNGTFTITLASTGVPTGKELTIKNIGVGTITLSSAVNIDGATTLALTTQYQSVIVRFDGTQWWIY